GRVRRLRPPHWGDTIPMGLFGELYQRDKSLALDMLRLQIDLQSSQLNRLGINVNCSPVLDIRYPKAHDIVGDRGLSDEISTIIALGNEVVERFSKNGIFPVIKHMPGHGRAMADSHLELPVVDLPKDILEISDFKPFIGLRNAPFAMTAHILFPQLDSANCATMSPHIIKQIIRKDIGFQGLLMTDDLSMKALSGSFAERSKSCLDAGCDLILHCNGDFDEMTEVSLSLKNMDKDSLKRWDTAKSLVSGDKFTFTRYEEETAANSLKSLIE
ncbi:MAG: glycoside hydrolase family 3 N-terminal domain-containing protein, partial [Alphaproteobacteria bacterium]|nr:glycoside hydrolase family 3 N-terminal domain-containing protein [Alphaproteobacteria bacterium]